MSNILDFPKSRVVRDLSPEALQEQKLLHQMQQVNTAMVDASTKMMNSLISSGVLTTNRRVATQSMLQEIKHVEFLNMVLLALIQRKFGIPNRINDMIDAGFFPMESNMIDLDNDDEMDDNDLDDDEDDHQITIFDILYDVNLTPNVS